MSPSTARFMSSTPWMSTSSPRLSLPTKASRWLSAAHPQLALVEHPPLQAGRDLGHRFVLHRQHTQGATEQGISKCLEQVSK